MIVFTFGFMFTAYLISRCLLIYFNFNFINYSLDPVYHSLYLINYYNFSFGSSSNFNKINNFIINPTIHFSIK